LWKLLPLRRTNLRRAARWLLIFMLLRLDRFLRASVGHELHAAFLVDYTYPEPLAEFVGTLAPLFVLTFFAHNQSIAWRLNFVNSIFSM
jgi:hypothetical protein